MCTCNRTLHRIAQRIRQKGGDPIVAEAIEYGSNTRYRLERDAMEKAPVLRPRLARKKPIPV